VLRIGIDAGGSHTEALLQTDDARSLVRWRGGPGAVRPGTEARIVSHWLTVVHGVLAEAGAPSGPIGLVIGAAGSGRVATADALQAAMEAGLPAGSTVRVVADGVIALEAAFPSGESGIVVMAGSGSIGFARSADGTLHRVGGYGWQMGDEGSGYALGRAALMRVARSLDGREPRPAFAIAVQQALALGSLDELVAWSVQATPSEVATLAHTVCTAATEGDPAAVTLVAESADDLANLVRALLPQIDARAPQVALGGGLLQPDSPVRAASVTRIEELAPGVCILTEVVDPPLGALRLARTM
jgi:N-acetylglucosamine kinase-like BadF-type ATPase